MDSLTLADKLRDMGQDAIALELHRSASTVWRWIRAVELGQPLTERQAAELVRGTRNLRWPLMHKDFKAHVRADANQ